MQLVSWISNVITIHQRQKGRRTTCDRKTALCTKVHCTVKKIDPICQTKHQGGGGGVCVMVVLRREGWTPWPDQTRGSVWLAADIQTRTYAGHDSASHFRSTQQKAGNCCHQMSDFTSTMHIAQIPFLLGLCPRLRWGSLQRSSRLPSWLTAPPQEPHSLLALRSGLDARPFFSWGNKIISWGNKKVSWGNKIISWGNKITSWGNKIVSWGNKIISWGNKITSWENKIVSWGNKMISWGNKKVSWGNKIISWGNKILCRSLKIVSWGNDISFSFLREQYKFLEGTR